MLAAALAAQAGTGPGWVVDPTHRPIFHPPATTAPGDRRRAGGRSGARGARRGDGREAGAANDPGGANRRAGVAEGAAPRPEHDADAHPRRSAPRASIPARRARRAPFRARAVPPDERAER